MSRSKSLFARAQGVIPGGVNSPVRAFKSVHRDPLFIQSGLGCKIYDVDDNEYIDHLNNYTVQLLGHNNAAVREAAIQQLQMGMSFAAPHENQTLLADELCQRIPCFEQVRFCNSGTEATMFAIRAARALS